MLVEQRFRHHESKRDTAAATENCGDKAGSSVFRALLAADCATWPGDPATLTWSGAQLVAAGIPAPALHGALLSNAYDRCPADERVPARTRIRAPSRAERTSPANLARLDAELAAAHVRGLRQVLAMGRVAADLLAPRVAALPGVTLVRLPHPSAQGLLMAAPDQGAGCSLAALGAAWEARLVALLRAGAAEAGCPTV